MDPYYNKNPYFQNEYILEEQYISYNENNYDYGYNWEVQGWDGGIETGPEYEEELGHGLEVEERFGEGVGSREEIGREWEEEGRGEGEEYEYDEPGQVYQDYQPEMQTDDEIGYEVPYGGSTPPWEHPYPTLDSPFANYTYAVPSQWTCQSPPSLPCYSQRRKQMTRQDTKYLMEGLLHPGNTPTLPWTLPLPTMPPPLSPATARNGG